MIRKTLKVLWHSIDFVRKLFINLCFLAVVSLLLVVFFYEKPVTVQDRSLMVIEMSGEVVEEGSLVPGSLALLLEGTATQTRLCDVVRALDLAAADKRISAALVRVKDLQKAGLASLREIGAAMDRFKASGKKITVWSTGYSQVQYAVAAHASEVFVHPMGQVLLRGFSGTRVYWGEALNKLGVTVHVWKVGEFKSAPEIFLYDKPTKESEAAERFWMKDAWAQFVNDIESSRGLMPGAIDKMIATLPEKLEQARGDMSSVALNENLIDAVNTSDEMLETLCARLGVKKVSELNQIDYLTYLDAQKEETVGKAVAVVTIEGEIKDGADGPGMTGERSVISRIRQARDDASVAALVIRIDSPGGSSVASELIRRELELVKKAGKPVVASFGDYAASGGYWVALAADSIVTDPSSITGSIGVFGMMPTFEKSLKRLSLGTGGASTAWLADAENPATPVSPAFGKMMALTVERTYRDFVALVAKSRNLSEAKVRSLAQGRVYTGRQALERGLADALGGLDAAVHEAAALAKLTDKRVRYIRNEEDGLSFLVGRLMRSAAETTGIVSSLRGLEPAARFFANPVERLQKTVTTETGIYAHCLCSAP